MTDSRAEVAAEAGAQTAILQLQGIVKRFANSAQPAIARIDLELRPGEILSLLGPSGCGKTTLLRIIAGFERPDAGTILIRQQPVAHLPPEQRGVGMVFQDYALFPHLTVAKNVAFGLGRAGGSRLAPKQVSEALGLVGLVGYQSRYPHELSGGQQQRIALARALAPAPALVLLDEPMSNLDVQVRLRLRQELRSILKQAGTSAIFVTHDQEEALSMADRVVVMDHGHIEQIGTPEEIYQHPATRFVADFVTQANFIPAQRTAAGWETELGTVPAAAMAVQFEQAAKRGQGELQGELMVRQEDLELVADERGMGVVGDRQFLGREHRYSIQLPSGQTLFVRRLSGDLLPVGAKVQLRLGGECRIFESNPAID